MVVGVLSRLIVCCLLPGPKAAVSCLNWLAKPLAERAELHAAHVPIVCNVPKSYD